jgi:hypothetical protein
MHFLNKSVLGHLIILTHLVYRTYICSDLKCFKTTYTMFFYFEAILSFITNLSFSLNCVSFMVYVCYIWVTKWIIFSLVEQSC